MNLNASWIQAIESSLHHEKRWSQGTGRDPAIAAEEQRQYAANKVQIKLLIRSLLILCWNKLSVLAGMESYFEGTL